MEKHTTHAINLRTKRTIPILLDILRYFFKKRFQKNSSLSSLTQELEEAFTGRSFDIDCVVEKENWKSTPLTPLNSNLKGIFQFYLIYRDIFSKNELRKTYHSHHLPKNWKNPLQIMTLRLFLLLKMKMEKAYHSRH